MRFGKGFFRLGAGRIPSSITDLFNGFNRTAGDSFTGGPTVVADNTGALVTSPVNVLAVQGARYAAGWLPTDANGSELWAGQAIRTRKGGALKYSSAFKGFLNEPARTNKVTCRKHNPLDTTNLQVMGDPAATLTVVDDTAALTAAGLIGICTNGKVYKLDNSAGVSDARANFTGSVGNLNPHSFTVCLRCPTSPTATNYISLSGGSALATFGVVSGYTRLGLTSSRTPTGTGELAQVWAKAGSVIYFILPQLEEGAFVTSIIPGDTLGSVTRAATVYSRPTAGVLRANDWGVWGRVVPGDTPVGLLTNILFASFMDGANYSRVGIYNSKVFFGKRVENVLYEISNPTFTPTFGIPFEFQVYQSSNYGMGLRIKVDGGNWSAWNFKNDAGGVLAPPVAANWSIGSASAGSHFRANYPFTAIIQHSDPKAKLEELAARYP